MLNEEQLAQRRNRAMTCIMLCLGILLMVLFVTSCQDSLTPPEATNPAESTEATTEPTTVPTEPSKFAGYTAVFGENSLQSALTGVEFETLTEQDKEAIETVMKNLGGTVEFAEETITLTLEGQSVVFYSDLSTVLIDAEGNAGGTRWLESNLSKLVTPLSDKQPAMCLTKADSFAAKYQVDAVDVYNTYCTDMEKLGWTTLSNTDMMYTAERTVEEIGKCSLTVSFADNVLTILVQVIPEEAPEATN
ncbi:MAG: hypothetical protein IJZ68_08820 [Bacteroidaceae bacterium]|nr:hypothetical protein [Bacteroidaceae bacterium]